MTEIVQAVVTRARGINGQHADGDVIALPVGQFEDWRSIGWVDRATPAQIAAAKAMAEKAEQVRIAAEKKSKAKPA